MKPDFPDFHYNMGHAYVEIEKLMEARACYEKAIELDPEHTDALGNLGNVFMRLGLREKSLECHLRAIEIDSDFERSKTNLKLLSL